MATNKHAQIRYNILDRCFSNFNRVFTKTDLLEEVNNHLFEIGTEGIQLRQLQYDISYLKSEDGYNIILNEDLKEGKKRVYRYADRNYSIANHPLNLDDSEQLETTLAILSRYKHREEFNWLEELIPRMEQAFDLVASGENGAIGYQENIDLKGREHIGTLFNLILKRKKTNIIYEPYGKPQQDEVIFPYHLKQFNNRWFLFCYNEKYNSISNYPLDRIVGIHELSEDFPMSTINWMDYFDDVIGVTKPIDGEIKTIKLKFTEKRINYITTKPLHGTQKSDKTDECGLTVTIDVIPNPELYQVLLSFGSDLEVVSPQFVRNEMMSKIKAMSNSYE